MIENLPNEEWKPVPGWETRYMVSNMGRLKSLNYCNKNREGLIKPGQNRKGGNGYLYLCANDRTSGRRENIYIHRLVAELWVPNATGKPCVNHLDEDVTNNRFDNLAWCTAKENCNYGLHNQRLSKACKNRTPWNKGKTDWFHWYNNGVENVAANECPDGFKPGRLPWK